MKVRSQAASLWQEFKAFAFKGNMIDLAVAVVIGAAFSGVINSLVKDIIMPSISYVTTAATQAGKAVGDVAQHAGTRIGITSQPATTQATGTQPAAAVAETPPPAPAAAPPDPNKPVDISWTIGRIRIGNFIGELLNFILIAFAVFLVIVKMLGTMVKKVGGTPKPSEPTTKECPFCLSVIPYKARKCANCTADLPSVDAPSAPASTT